MYYVINDRSVNECLVLFYSAQFDVVLGEILCGLSLFSAIQNILGVLSLILLGDE